VYVFWENPMEKQMKNKIKIRVVINRIYDVKLNKKAPELGAFNITLMFAFL
jgi:hypothetical protein